MNDAATLSYGSYIRPLHGRRSWRRADHQPQRARLLRPKNKTPAPAIAAGSRRIPRCAVPPMDSSGGVSRFHASRRRVATEEVDVTVVRHGSTTPAFRLIPDLHWPEP